MIVYKKNTYLPTQLLKGLVDKRLKTCLRVVLYIAHHDKVNRPESPGATPLSVGVIVCLDKYGLKREGGSTLLEGRHQGTIFLHYSFCYKSTL